MYTHLYITFITFVSYIYINFLQLFLEYSYLSNSYCFPMRKYNILENRNIKYSYTYNEFQFGDGP